MTATTTTTQTWLDELVAEIVDAYARYDADQEQQAAQSVHAVPGRAASGGARPGRPITE